MSINTVGFLGQYQPDSTREAPTGINNARRRIFGLLQDGESLKEIGLFGKIAYRAQSGMDYLELSPRKLEAGAMSQLHGGRSLEVLICEGLIRQRNGFHFLPPKELDTRQKIDMCSRRPYRDANGILRTFCIGTQLTVAEIPENKQSGNLEAMRRKGLNPQKYEEKLHQMEMVTPFLHDPTTRKEIKRDFGKLVLPDIICYVAINGELRKTLGNASGYMKMTYKEWRNSGYRTSSLQEHFKPHLRDSLAKVSGFIDWTQSFIYSSNFIDGMWKKGEGEDVLIEHPGYQIQFLRDSERLIFSLFHDNEVICKVTYLFYADDINKLSQKLSEHKKYLQNHSF